MRFAANFFAPTPSVDRNTAHVECVSPNTFYLLHTGTRYMSLKKSWIFDLTAGSSKIHELAAPWLSTTTRRIGLKIETSLNWIVHTTSSKGEEDSLSRYEDPYRDFCRAVLGDLSKRSRRKKTVPRAGATVAPALLPPWP